MLYYERKFAKRGFEFIIGVDEVGRGPLAGPVLAGAVWLERGKFKNPIVDSKRLRHRQREKAFLEIIDKSTFDIGIVSEKVIDRINILEASRLAMKQAVLGLIKKISDKNKRSRNIKYLLY